MVGEIVEPAQQLRVLVDESPQGVGEPLKGHKCAGVDFSTLLMKAFMVRLVRDYDTKLPKQDLSYQWEKIPPEYASGLRAVLSPVRSAP